MIAHAYALLRPQASPSCALRIPVVKAPFL
jgi:hypothetical protein